MIDLQQLENARQGFANSGWFPVLTLLLGYLIKSVSDWVQDRRSLRREREARQSTRRDQLLERRATFQRETLLGLQEALMSLGRATGAMHVYDRVGYDKTGVWRKNLYPPDLDESARMAFSRTSMFMVRVRGASVREMVIAARGAAAAVTKSASLEESLSAFATAMGSFEDLMRRIGELVRTIDEET